MGAYYMQLALGSFRRNPVLTALMVLAIAIGVAMSMTAYTILAVMARDPIPWKSSQLFAVQVDNGGPRSRAPGDQEPPTQLAWRDITGLMAMPGAARHVAMHQVALTITPADRTVKPFSIAARATTPDFFAMFDVPMLAGRTWSAAEELRGVASVVITRKLAERLFGSASALGQRIDLGGDPYTIIGVTGDWDPRPRFYDVINGQDFEEGEDAYLPLSVADAKEMSTSEFEFCDAGPRGESFADLKRSECVWLQYWVELPTAAARDAYRNNLENYARDQQRTGRFHWAPNVRLRDVPAWLAARKVVPNDAKLSTLVAFGFFLACLVSALGLMLAKSLERGTEFSLRRALGASARGIFAQALTESGLLGLAGGIAGLVLTFAALAALRALFPDGMARIAHMDAGLVATGIVVSVAATLLFGLYPAWRAMRIMPALQLKDG